MGASWSLPLFCHAASYVAGYMVLAHVQGSADKNSSQDNRLLWRSHTLVECWKSHHAALHTSLCSIMWYLLFVLSTCIYTYQERYVLQSCNRCAQSTVVCSASTAVGWALCFSNCVCVTSVHCSYIFSLCMLCFRCASGVRSETGLA